MRPDRFYKEDEYAVLRLAGPVLTPENPWAALKLAQADPNGVIGTLSASGLTGRGGAGFPVGLKWKSVREETNTMKYVICNSSEGEPGTAANRILWEQVPEKVLCGIVICARVIGAQKAYIYLRESYCYLTETMERLIEANRDKISPLDIEIFPEPGGYVCGEETALMETLEGNRGETRLKPPYPTAEGAFHCPTVLNNVESFANIPGILLHGAEAFRRMGTEKTPGSKLYTLSGPVKAPGVYELPVGVTLRELYEACGGLTEGTLKGMQAGGASGNFLRADQLDTAFAPGVPGISFGVGDVRFIADGESVPEMTLALMNFFAAESCGVCIPCKYGLLSVCEQMEHLLRDGMAENLTELRELGGYINQSARCAMGQAASGCLLSALDTFPEEFDTLLKRGAAT